MENYCCQMIADEYVIYEGEKVLLTPGGKAVQTRDPEIAKKLLLALKRRGYDYRSPSSFLTWHFTYMDKYADMDINEIKTFLKMCFFFNDDWTCTAYKDKNWKQVFGKWEERKKEIEKWLDKCTVMQLTAVAVLANAYGSINFAYVVATIIENNGEKAIWGFKNLTYMCARDKRTRDVRESLTYCLVFNDYYGIHLKQNGKIINNPTLNVPIPTEKDIKSAEQSLAETNPQKE